MSYDIYYINRKDLDIEDVSEILESEGSEKDDFYISKEMMVKIRDEMKKRGLKFESIDQNSEMELNFDTFQVSMFPSQIAISVPYWEENRQEKAVNEIEIVNAVLADSGLTGYDPQSELLYDESFPFSETADIWRDKPLSELETAEKEEPRKPSTAVKIIAYTIIIGMLCLVIWLISLIF